ncbi:MAG TPA: hypothetical protein VMR54_08845 [Thermoanaerobaculia bacterium]|nr:hypothetical protein [Thermoanaerobaculia bacterium]
MRLPHRRFLALVLVLLPAALSQAQAPAEPNVADAVARAETTPGNLTGAPQPTGYESDLYCFGFLGGSSEPFAAQVISAAEVAEQTDFITHDVLYLDAGADRGLRPGDEYWIVTPENEVVSPVDGRILGLFYQYRGRGVILCIQGHSAVLRVLASCTDIPIGAYLKKFEPIPIPLARKGPPAVVCDPPSGKPQGHIVYSRDGVVALGQDTDVIVDLGVANGLQPGDFLTIYRYSTGREYGIRPQGYYWVNVPPPPGLEIPRTYLGEVAILAVGDRWAVGRITDSYRLIEIGDEVEVK